jgi:hypothetical protein
MLLLANNRPARVTPVDDVWLEPFSIAKVACPMPTLGEALVEGGHLGAGADQ